MQHAALKPGDTVAVRGVVTETMSDRVRISIGDRALSHVVYVPRDQIVGGYDRMTVEASAIETPPAILATLCGPLGRHIP